MIYFGISEQKWWYIAVRIHWRLCADKYLEYRCVNFVILDFTDEQKKLQRREFETTD